MKHILLAISLAAAAPAFAVDASAPHDQSQVDRLLPTVPERSEQAASSRTPRNVWAADYHFVAPAQ